MEEFGISEELFTYVVLPLLIFLARVTDVSINTIRIIYVLGGRRLTATLLGFVESFIWLMAIRQIFQHLDNWVSYFAYPAGFAMGILVGMIIEEKIAYGKVIVRIITHRDVTNLIAYLNDRKFRYTRVDATGERGKENLVFTVLERDQLEDLLKTLRTEIPSAFYTVEKVNRAAESAALTETRRRWDPVKWLRNIRRE